nr:MAG TPA: hypothetical protein [Bacteriophage sp.]
MQTFPDKCCLSVLKLNHGDVAASCGLIIRHSLIIVLSESLLSISRLITIFLEERLICRICN